MFIKIYNNIIAIIRRITINNDVYFIAKICYKDAFTKNVIIVNYEDIMISNCGDIMILSCGGVMIIGLFYNENDKDGEDIIISASYSYIKFITLFKYLTLYYISNFNL